MVYVVGPTEAVVIQEQAKRYLRDILATRSLALKEAKCRFDLFTKRQRLMG